MLLIDNAKERAELLVRSAHKKNKNMKVSESYWKGAVAEVCYKLRAGLSCLVVSGVP